MFFSYYFIFINGTSDYLIYTKINKVMYFNIFMFRLEYRPTSVFRIIDKEALKNYISSNLPDSEDNHNIINENILFIIIRGISDKPKELPKNDTAYVERDDYVKYNTFNIHENKNVSKGFWYHYRLKYLLDEGIIERYGSFDNMDVLEVVEEKSKKNEKVNLNDINLVEDINKP